MADNRPRNEYLMSGAGNLGARTERYEQLEKESQISGGQKKGDAAAAQTTPTIDESIDAQRILEAQQTSQTQQYLEGAGAAQEEYRKKITLSQRFARFKKALAVQQSSQAQIAQEQQREAEATATTKPEVRFADKMIKYIRYGVDISNWLFPLIPFIGLFINDAVSFVGIWLIILIRIMSRPKKIKIPFHVELELYLLQFILEFISGGILPSLILTGLIEKYIEKKIQKRMEVVEEANKQNKANKR